MLIESDRIIELSNNLFKLINLEDHFAGFKPV